ERTCRGSASAERMSRQHVLTASFTTERGREMKFASFLPFPRRLNSGPRTRGRISITQFIGRNEGNDPLRWLAKLIGISRSVQLKVQALFLLVYRVGPIVRDRTGSNRLRFFGCLFQPIV